MHEIGRWIIGKCAISFWKSNWLGQVLDPTNSANITVKEGLSEIDKWRPALTDEQWYQASRVNIDDQEDDRVVCTLTANGKFKVSAYIPHFRNSRPKKVWTDKVWNRHTPIRVNAFMWKVFSGALAVEGNIQERGVVIASKCVCCEKPMIETTEHLLIHSDVARTLWAHFAPKLKKTMQFQSINHLIRLWLHGTNPRSQLGMTSLAIIFYGLWEIWKTRCKMRFEDEKYNANIVLHRVYQQVYALNLIHNPKRQPSNFERICLEDLALPVKQIQVKRGRWLSWMKPLTHEFKLNVDGSRKAHLCAGGGVVRDRQGDFICGFSHPYSSEDIIEAELQAMADGVRLCRERGLQNVSIETDAAMVVRMLREVNHTNWRYVYLIRRVQQQMKHVGDVTLIFREQNMVADYFAKSALGSKERKEMHSITETPGAARKLIFLDRIGIPNFRSPCN